MISGVINARDIGELPSFKEGDALKVFPHPLIGVSTLALEDAWAILVYEKLDGREIEANSLDEVYARFSHHEGEALLLEAAHGPSGFALRLVYSGNGLAPVYFHQSGSKLHLDWDSARLADSLPLRRLDFQYFCKTLVSGVYSHRTPWSNISMLPAGGELSWDGSIVALKILDTEQLETRPGSRSSASTIVEMTTAHLKRRSIPGVRLAAELSGGMDSSLVALCAMEAGADLRLIMGIDIGYGYARQEQLSRRATVVQKIGIADHLIDIKDYPPHYGPRADGAEDRYLMSEEYEDAFAELWRAAAHCECNAITGGYGGDELFPTFVSETTAYDRLRTVTDETQKAIKSAYDHVLTPTALEAIEEALLGEIDPFPLAMSSRVAVQRRAPLLLQKGFWPIFPLFDRALAIELRSAPLADRHEKAALQAAIKNMMGPVDLFANYTKETLQEATDHAVASQLSGISAGLRSGRLVHAGILKENALAGVDLSRDPWSSVVSMLQTAEKFLQRSVPDAHL